MLCILRTRAALGRAAGTPAPDRSAFAAPPGGGLEFLPPASPYFDYASGRASPYGEQTAVLARSLAACGGLNCRAYAALLFQTLGSGFEGYR